MHELMPLQLRALHKGLAALGAHVDARTVCVKVLPHGCVVSEHLSAALSQTRDGVRQHWQVGWQAGTVGQGLLAGYSRSVYV